MGKVLVESVKSRGRPCPIGTSLPLRKGSPCPIGTLPPIQRPFFLEAAILSLIRSAVTSLSNCAKLRSMFRVSRPMLVAVLNDWVTETKEAPAASSLSTIFAKSESDRVSLSIL